MQRKLVTDGRAITNTVTNDYRPEPIALRIRGCRTDTGTRAASGNQQRINLMLDQIRRQMGSKKGAGVFFFKDQVFRLRCYSFVDLTRALIP